MKTQGWGRLAGLAAAGALALTACGSAPDTGGTVGGSGTTAAAATGDIQCFEGTLQGSGSSAQANAMDQWISRFQQACPEATINYQSVGSGAGRQQFVDGQTDWGGSDAALSREEIPAANERCAPGRAVNLPMVTGPIAVAYHLRGVDDLVLDAETLAGIFSGEITRWNDTAIAELNPGTDLPDMPIQDFHRSDDSGTTENFTRYLQAAAGDAWTYGTAGTWSAPGGQGAKGSEGVSTAVKQAPGSITYVEVSFAKLQDLSVAKLDTGAGEPVALTPSNAGKAVAQAEIVGEGKDLTLRLDYATEAPGAYPVVLVTYEIVCTKGNEQAKALRSFLGFTSSEAGQRLLSEIGYAPLPESVAAEVRDVVSTLA